MTDKKWQWVEKKRQYGYVSRKSKKYVCMWVCGIRPDTGGYQVKPMVATIAEEGTQTTEYSESENNENVVTDYREGYSGSGVLKSESMAQQINQ